MVNKMVEIECLACGKAIKPRQLNDTDNYDTENYDGQIVCQECKSLLYVKSVKGKVQKSKVVENKSKQTKSLTYADIVKSAEDLERHPPALLIETSEKATDVATGESKRGEAPLKKPPPLPLIKGKGIKGIGLPN